MHTPSDYDYLATLAAILFIILGAMLMPLLTGAARLTGRVLGFAIRAGVTEAVSAARLEILKWVLVALLALFGLGFAHAASAEGLGTAKPVATIAIAVTPAVAPESAAVAIERLMPVIARAAKHPGVQVAGLALRGVTAYQLYVLRREVAEVRQTTLAMLKDIASVIARVEHGEQLSAAQWAEAHDRLDGHARRLDDLAARVDRLEPRVDALETAMVRRERVAREWARFNRVCKEAEHVWRPGLGKCVHISVAGPRR